MDKDELNRALSDYAQQLDVILSRSPKGQDSGHIHVDDDPYFRQLVIELKDLLDDCLGVENSYTRMIMDYYHEGIKNPDSVPSISSTRNMRGVLAAVMARIKRNPELLKHQGLGEHVLATNQLSLPKKVTLAWLFRHVPLNLWVMLGSFLVTACVLGIGLAQLPIVQQYLLLQTGEITPGSTARVHISQQPDLQAQLRELSKAHNANIMRLQEAILRAQLVVEATRGSHEETRHREMLAHLKTLVEQENQVYLNNLSALIHAPNKNH